MTAITSLKHLLGNPNDDNDDFELWLQTQDNESPGLLALNCGLDDELRIEAVEPKQQAAPAPSSPAPFTFNRVLAPMTTCLQAATEGAAQDVQDVKQGEQTNQQDLLTRVENMERRELLNRVEHMEHALARHKPSADAKLDTTTATDPINAQDHAEKDVLLSPPPFSSRSASTKTPSTKRLSTEEHLASAVLLQAKENRKLSLPDKTTTLGYFLNMFGACKTHAAKLSVHHWASLALVCQFARPWAGPVIKHFIEALLTHLLGRLMAVGGQLPQWMRLVIARTAAITYKAYLTVTASRSAITHAPSPVPAATAAVTSSALQSTPTATFSDAINLDQGSMMMITAGGKRSADDASTDEAPVSEHVEEQLLHSDPKTMLIAAAKSMLDRYPHGPLSVIQIDQSTVTHREEQMTSALTMLAPLLGVYRVYKGTITAIGTALARRIWSLGTLEEA